MTPLALTAVQLRISGRGSPSRSILINYSSVPREELFPASALDGDPYKPHTRKKMSTLTAAQVEELERLHPGDLQRGYNARLGGKSLPANASPAFEHGYQCAVSDLEDGNRDDWPKRMLARDVMTPPWVRDALNSGANDE
jgi:hypothetical protein